MDDGDDGKLRCGGCGASLRARALAGPDARTLCPDCHGARPAAHRRLRPGRMVALVLAAALLIGGALGWSMRQSLVRFAPADGGAIASHGVAPEPQTLIEPAPPPDQPIAPAEPAASPPPADASPDRSAEAQPSDDDRADAVERAIRHALDRGRPERWHAGGASGYVVPSELEADDERVCRNVVATAIQGGDQTESRPRRWCREQPDEEWTPRD